MSRRDVPEATPDKKRGMSRRSLAVATIAAASVLAGPTHGQPATTGARSTFVLVHGSWHGAWCWSRVADELTAQGHRVFAVTQTGVGDRKHLASAAVGIDVFVDDIVNLIEAEELTGVVLVGHSFAGIPITGAASRLPDRIRSLVYLDAGVPNPGDSAISSLSPAEQDARRKAAVRINGIEFLPAPDPLPAFWGLTGADADWVARRLTPHPFATYTSGLEFDEAAWARLPRTYIQCTAPRHPAVGALQARIKDDRQWRWAEIAAGHDAMVSRPKELARLLLS